MEWSNYNYLYYSLKAKNYLLYNALSNMFIVLDDEGYQTIQKIKSDPDCEETKSEEYRFLLDKRVIVNSNQEEENKLVLTALTNRFRSDIMSLTIAPTLLCNFNCPYCYENHRHNKKMDAKVLNGIVDFVKKSGKIKHLKVTWYGGEPTMVIPTIRALSKELQQSVENYDAFMVTNGYRIDKIADELSILGISSVQITLDGTENTHNKTRKLLNNKGTFKKIMDNIGFVLSKNDKITISIRMNISHDNLEEYEPLSKLLEHRFGKKRVILYPAFVEDYSGCQLSNCFENKKEKAAFLKELYYRKGIFTNPLFPQRTGKGCMRQSLNSFVIGPSGELYKCWHHLGNKDKVVGNIFGSEIDYSLLSNMMVGNDVLFIERCKKCVLFPSCDGGCSDIRDKGIDVCIPAKAMLKDFLDIKYLEWKKTQKSE